MSQYATTTNLQNLGLPAAALTSVSTTIQDEHLVKASGVVDSYLRGRTTLPLVAPYPDEIIDATCRIAAYTLLVRRGFNPDAYDANFRALYEDAIRWLKDVSAGRANLAQAADTSTAREGAPRIQSGEQSTTPSQLRGW